jgi:hypothetical protein
MVSVGAFGNRSVQKCLEATRGSEQNQVRLSGDDAINCGGAPDWAVAQSGTLEEFAQEALMGGASAASRITSNSASF